MTKNGSYSQTLMDDIFKNLKISESYLLGVDIAFEDSKDVSMIMVSRYEGVPGKKLVVINTIIGKEAEEIYKILKGDNKNE